MGISKQMEIEEMDRISREEYDEDDRAKNDDAAFCAKENYDSDIAAAAARRQLEDRLIEQQIEDELQTLVELEADMNTVQKAAYAHLSEGKTMVKERILLIKSILSDYKYEVKNNG
jgi:major membrane immunogen (membrane-anchored lipoprotein)